MTPRQVDSRFVKSPDILWSRLVRAGTHHPDMGARLTWHSTRLDGPAHDDCDQNHASARLHTSVPTAQARLLRLARWVTTWGKS